VLVLHVSACGASTLLPVGDPPPQCFFHKSVTATTVPCFKSFILRDFRFIVLTYVPTYTHRDKVIAISTPPYYVVGADKNHFKISIKIRNSEIHADIQFQWPYQ